MQEEKFLYCEQGLHKTDKERTEIWHFGKLQIMPKSESFEPRRLDKSAFACYYE